MDQFDTKLDPESEQKFQKWKAQLPKPLQDDSNYDLRGAFLGGVHPSANDHLPDTYKKPNHPTFSQESKYSTPENPGGAWMQVGPDNWIFMAAPANLKYQTADELSQYFDQNEPNSTVVLPVDFNLTPGKKP